MALKFNLKCLKNLKKNEGKNSQNFKKLTKKQIKYRKNFKKESHVKISQQQIQGIFKTILIKLAKNLLEKY